MDESKRRFLRIAGVSALGIGWCVPVARAVASAFSSNVTASDAAMKASRWAMVVDTRKCLKAQKKGCQACAEVCHSIHNVPKIDSKKEEIKWIWTEDFHHAFPDQANPDYLPEHLAHAKMPVLCNHCDHPPCVRVCPTQATFRRDDGLVMMDQHRCIGCRFCIAACPYGARSFNWSDPRKHPMSGGTINSDYPTRTKGVVEKCTFCAARLARGRIPACVEACKAAGHGALAFGDLKSPEIAGLLKKHHTIRRKPGLGTLPHVFYIV